MKVEVDSKLTISPNEQVLLEMLLRGENEMAYRFLKKVQPKFLNVQKLDYMKNLQDRGFIKSYTSSLSMVEFGPKLKSTVAGVDKWIQEYRDLFPKFKKGDKKSCTKKMKDFLASNNDWGKDVVIRATKMYLSEYDTPTYVTQADYFIQKNDQSKLYQYCEEIDVKDAGGAYEELA